MTQQLDKKTSNTSLCTLSAITWGLLNSPDELEQICDMTVRMLDALIDTNVYLNKLSENETKASRYLGIGVTDFAHFLAKHHLKYQDPEALSLVHEYAEAQCFYLLKASMNLAKELGACENFYRTKYSLGLLPIDHYNKNVDTLVPHVLKLDWEQLRQDILQYGLRNSSVVAIMPCQSSSVVSNSTGGIEPPRAYLSKVKSKSGLSAQIVPEYSTLKDYYSLAYDKDFTPNYLKITAILQKFTDQGISVNTYYSPSHYGDNKVPQSVVVQDILTHFKFGGKTMYYSNTDDGRDANETPVMVVNDVVPVIDFFDGSSGSIDGATETYVDADGVLREIGCDCPVDPVEREDCDACNV